MAIPFLDLGELHRPLRAEIAAAIERVMDTSSFVLGQDVGAFEREFADWIGVEHAVAVNSGTSALHLALLANNIGPGDEVVTVSMTFVATVAAIVYTGATPVFVDVDPVAWTMDPLAIESAITERTKAIVPVHLHGRVADMSAIQTIAARHHLAVIEDAAQAHGVALQGMSVGGFGAAAAFSFYPGKNLGAMGDGGAVTTRDADVADRVRLLRDWGARQKYHHEVHAYNMRLDSIQAAILRVKLPHLRAWTAQRRELALAYDRLLGAAGIRRAQIPDDPNEHVFHVYSVHLDDRDVVLDRLKKSGIGTGIHYPIPVHLLTPYERYGGGAGSLPVTEDLAKSFLSLPMCPTLGADDAEQVVSVLLESL